MRRHRPAAPPNGRAGGSRRRSRFPSSRAEPAPPLDGRHDRRRRDPGRRVHRDVDRLVPEGARAGHRRRAARTGHLRRRSERPQRRLRRRVARRTIGDLIREPTATADAMELLIDAVARASTRSAAWCRDRTASTRGSATAATSPSRRTTAHEGAGSGSLEAAPARLGVEDRVPAPRADEVQDRCAAPRFGERDVHPRRRDRAARAPGARPPRRAARPRTASGSSSARRSRGSAWPRRASTAETPGGSVRAGEAVVGLGAWATSWKAFSRGPDAPGFVHGGHRAGARPARGARLDRRRGDPRPALVDPLRCGPRPTVGSRSGSAALQPNLARRGSSLAYDDEPRYARASPTTCTGCSRRFEDVPIEAAWGGPINVSGFTMPFFGPRPAGQRALRARLHGQRRRPVAPGRQDPRRAGHCTPRTSFARLAVVTRTAEALPARAVPLARDARRERGDPAQGRPRRTRGAAWAASRGRSPGSRGGWATTWDRALTDPDRPRAATPGGAGGSRRRSRCPEFAGDPRRRRSTATRPPTS